MPNLPAESLEPRRLLAASTAGADPARLLASLPAVTQNINVRLGDPTPVGAQLFFTGYRDFGGERLYSTNPAAGSAPLFSAVTSSSTDNLGVTALTPFQGKLFFFGNGPAGDGLYSSDGTVDGTRPVKLLRTGSANVLPERAFVLNDRLYFFWFSTLYASDGTADGTAPVWDAPAGTRVMSISDPVDGHVFFGTLPFGGPAQLWRTDGTPAGTTAVWTNPDPVFPSSYPDAVTPAGDRLFFLSGGYGLHRLYAAARDGSGATEVRIPSALAGEQTFVSGVQQSLPVVGDRVLVVSPEIGSGMARLFATDGTPAGTEHLTDGLESVYAFELSVPVSLGNGRAVFVLRQGGSGGISGVYATDGTRTGTTRVGPYDPAIGIALNPTLATPGHAFVLDPSPVGVRVIETDGTPAGTHPVHYLAPGRVDGWWALTTFDGRAVVQAQRNGIPELWSLDPEVPTGAVSGVVFSDVNRDGARQGFEPKLPASLYLDLNGDGRPDPGDLHTTVEGFDPPYAFDGLPAGDYTVRVERLYLPNPSAPLDYPADGAHRVHLGPGQVVSTADFGVADAAPGAVWGVVFNDLDRDGVRDPGEPGVAGQMLYLDRNNDGLSNDGAEVRTADDGTYGFAGVAPGTYTVRRADAPGWSQVAPARRGGRTVTLAPGAPTVQADAFAVTASPAGGITVVLWQDWNADGRLDAGDTPFPYAETAYLDLNDDGKFDPREPHAYSPDPDGIYRFTNLAAETYTVRVTPSSDRTQTFPAGNAGQRVTVSLTSADAPLRFLIATPKLKPPVGVIAGSVFKDRDGDGRRDPGDVGVRGVTVWLDTDRDGYLDSNERRATTDARGDYVFPDTYAGSYVVRVLRPPTWTQTTPTGTAFEVGYDPTPVVQDVGLAPPPKKVFSVTPVHRPAPPKPLPRPRTPRH